jgi:hypothetical protein
VVRNLGGTRAKYSSTVLGGRADWGGIEIERARGALKVEPSEAQNSLGNERATRTM